MSKQSRKNIKLGPRENKNIKKRDKDISSLGLSLNSLYKYENEFKMSNQYTDQFNEKIKKYGDQIKSMNMELLALIILSYDEFLQESINFEYFNTIIEGYIEKNKKKFDEEFTYDENNKKVLSDMVRYFRYLQSLMIIDEE